ncbi:hypothetical protein NDA16_002465 [Ustilago loliicola]|nr:hypothetical protein NDA16_002465 [Ustilago loliicola]
MQLTRSTGSRPVALLLTALCLASTAASASIQSASVELSQPPSFRDLSTSSQLHLESRSGSLVGRHGDHGDEDEEEEDEHEHKHGMMAHEDAPVQHIQVIQHDHDHHDSHMTMSHTHEHSHSHHNDETQPTGPSPDSIPDASVAGTDLRPLPVWYHHGGHGHSHGSGPVRETLNETLLFRAKGPDPLSYIEWDFGYSLGSTDQLRRFTSDADILNGKQKMGVVDGRWRKLFDENDAETRQVIANDIASRLPESEGEPGRYRGLLILHVVTAVLSCFVLLPMTLVLRAAHSSLAPLVSLLYLGMLGGSMLLSIIYKALTPRLYPDNAHGSMGWAILWISLVTLGSDVFRLVGQLWAAVSAVRSSKRGVGQGAWLPTTSSTHVSGAPQSWKDVIGTLLGRTQRNVHSSESYDALEEEAMLSEEAQSDAHELDVEKHLSHRLGSRASGSRSGSGSPHRVHFDEQEHESGASTRRTRGASAESLVEPVDWVGSGSTAVSSTEHHRRGSPIGSDRVLVASPTTTACNTPRNSIFGGEATRSPSLSLNTFSLWRKEAAHEAPSLQDLPPAAGKLRSSRLDTFRTVLRYMRVVAARSLPVLAFATSYTGLAVYTGSCRGRYKNVCLAHGIKGGIFFWFGLLTFSRYLGAYADIGWAWNKRPSSINSKKRGGAGWRRNMPSAEFVECLVIFIYGATNTWMERFGAAPGDPYTIKQIQHISIAVMFWFAGLMGMLLETKFIRDMLSFPVALNHISAVPMREARRRRNNRTAGSRNTAESGADSDLDLLVEAQMQPASYSASFNPFPALVIGVTGVAMAAHHQDYVYEVQIHMLWGQLLAGFALLRCLTYFLLWLRPPSVSVLPSIPPTEALAAFSLCCGGLVFMLSSEEVSFAAMRSGYGDFMAILNVAVAVVALLFCWTTGLMLLKGWAVRREVRRSLYGEVETSSNALQLDTSNTEERAPRHMRASVVHAAPTTAGSEPVFVLEDEDERENDEPISTPAPR